MPFSYTLMSIICHHTLLHGNAISGKRSVKGMPDNRIHFDLIFGGLRDELAFLNSSELKDKSNHASPITGVFKLQMCHLVG